MITRFFALQRISSWIFRKLTRVKAPWFKNNFINLFAKLYKINWAESRRKKAEEFIHFNDFFTRELEEGARPIAESLFVSPADGKIAAFGQLKETQFIEAKGHHFELASLIANPELAQDFANGSFATIYLSPANYHRVHMPITGRLLESVHIPGRLYSVSLKTAERIPSLFAENERLVTIFETEIGRMILILVGAINVSSMETVWSGLVTPPYAKVPLYKNHEAEDITIEKGEEMGRFNMGSTAIVITEAKAIEFARTIAQNAPIRLGEQLMNPKITAENDPTLPQ